MNNLGTIEPGKLADRVLVAAAQDQGRHWSPDVVFYSLVNYRNEGYILSR